MAKKKESDVGLKKILIIANIFPNNQEPTKGVFLKQEVLELAKLYELKVVAPIPWALPIKKIKRWFLYSQIAEKEMLENIEVYHPRFLVIPKIARFSYGFFYFLSIFKLTKKIFANFKIDLIIAYYAYPDGFAAALLAKILKKQLIIKALGSDINVFTKGRIRRLLTTFALNSADRIISVTEDLKWKMVDLGISENKISVISNGVDSSKFRPMDKVTCRKELDFPQDKIIVMFIGNFVEVKGINYLIDAFALLQKEWERNYLLVLAGDGALRKTLEDKIQALGLSGAVKVVGRKPHENIPFLINACDVFCLPSINEGCPNVILEALACGKYIVATEVGGIPKLISSSKLGILVPPRDCKQLALGLNQAVCNILNEKNLGIPMQRSWKEVAMETKNEVDRLIIKRNNKMRGENIIYFSSDEWGSGLKTSQYHISVRLARDNKVLYVNSIGLRKPTVSKADFLRVIDKLKRCFKGVQRINRNLYVFTPIVVPFHGIGWVNAFNKFLLTTCIRYYQLKLGLRKPYIFTFLPNTVNILGRFGEKKVIYYCADQVSSFKGVDTVKIEAMEQGLLRKADFVFATSKQLYEQKKMENPRIYYMPHGVDAELFKKALDSATEVPADIACIRKPIIGFFGHVSADWVDFEIVTFLAERHPEWSIVLIGKVAADIPDLSAYRNIIILGSRDYLNLPNYSKAFDVAIIPFVNSVLTRNSNPLKLKEYLAAGCPVVATSIPELEQFATIIKIASKKEDFILAVEEYLRLDSQALRQERSHLMDKETWEHQFDTLVQIVSES